MNAGMTPLLHQPLRLNRSDGDMTAATPFLHIAGARKAFGDVVVLGGVDLRMPRGEFVSLLGPSGCGKTTLLRIIAGLLPADDGSVHLDGADITSLPPHRRDVGVVFQNYALFPHLTVAENVAFGLSARGRPKAEIGSTVRRFLDLIHMSEFADRSVRMLSGGQQQRVAVARALAVQPKLLLLDEPFSALDRKLRETMQIELKRLLRELAITAVFVTHDQDEALVMSDRIAVMNKGTIEQIADPLTIYRRPATPYVLGFVGLSSRIEGRVVGTSAKGSVIETAYGQLAGPSKLSAGSKVIVAVRPERIHIGEGNGNTLIVRFRDLVFQGSKALLHFDAGASEQIVVETADLANDALKAGAEVTLSWAVDDTLVYATEGGAT
jgi:putative spermidine/putrescine transport system ATP-binding protein